MDILKAVIKTLLRIVFVGFIAMVVLLILSVIMPENLQKALEILRGL